MMVVVELLKALAREEITPTTKSKNPPPTSASSAVTPKKATSHSPRPKDNYTFNNNETPMNTSLNLKRRRDSGEDQAKKIWKSTPKPQQDQSSTQEQVLRPLTRNSSIPSTKISNQPSSCSPWAFPLSSSPYHPHHLQTQSEDRLQMQPSM